MGRCAPSPRAARLPQQCAALGDDLVSAAFERLDPTDRQGVTTGNGASASNDAGIRALHWGHWDWPLTVSTPERAILELLDELPRRESFHQADVLMEGLSDLSPRRLQTLLTRCQSVKVKRLFLYFADRHQHAWLTRLDRSVIDLGSGKRLLVPNGRLDRAYQITVPRDLNAPEERA